MRELEAKGENKVEDDDENITDTSRMGIRERAEHKNEVVMKALLLEVRGATAGVKRHQMHYTAFLHN